MTVLITGAAGVLGREVVSLLEEDADIEVRLTDVVSLDGGHEFVQADLSRWDEAKGICDGVDQVLHIAAIHPWKEYTPDQYMDCNIKATHNVLRAAGEAGVKRLVYTSSIAAMGLKPASPAELPFDETKSCRPSESIYAVTKHVGEQLCEMFREQGLNYVALRPGTFVPCDETLSHFGVGLLYQWVHRTDVAAAHVLALKSDVENEAFIITAKAPFTREDGPALVEDARSVILRYFPEVAKLEDQGMELPQSITHCYTIEKAERMLGYRPKMNFGEWLESQKAAMG